MRRSAGRRTALALAGLALASLSTPSTAQGSFQLEQKLLPLTFAEPPALVGRRMRPQFGDALVTSGPYAAVGAPGFDLAGPERSVVFVYEDLGGAWSLVAELRAAVPLSNPFYGADLDLDGNTLLVGSPDASDGLSLAGAADVYRRDPGSGSWTFVTRLVSPTPQTRAYFGSQVAVCGDTIAVGATREDDQRGAIYVFERDPGDERSWRATRRIQLAPGRRRLGTSLDLSGDTIVAWSETTNATGGRVHVFERPTGPGGEWLEATSFFTNSGTNTRVAIDGDAFVMCEASTIRLNPPGFASVIERDPAGDWTLLTPLLPLVPPIDQTRLGFGNDCSLDGDTVVIGSRQFAPGAPAGGAAYVLQRSAPGSWSLAQTVQVPGATFDDAFGQVLSQAGGALFVAAPDDDVLGADSGSTFVFRRP